MPVNRAISQTEFFGEVLSEERQYFPVGLVKGVTAGASLISEWLNNFFIYFFFSRNQSPEVLTAKLEIAFLFEWRPILPVAASIDTSNMSAVPGDAFNAVKIRRHFTYLT